MNISGLSSKDYKTPVLQGCSRSRSKLETSTAARA